MRTTTNKKKDSVKKTMIRVGQIAILPYICCRYGYIWMIGSMIEEDEIFDNDVINFMLTHCDIFW